MSEFRNQAIFNTHSKVITINEHRGAVDQDDNLVTKGSAIEHHV